MKQTITTALLCIFVTFVTVKLSTQSTNVPIQQETGYDRVMKTNTLTCGYVVYPPYVMKDINTGELSGIMVDLWAEWGNQLELDIQWSEEVSWGTMIEGLNTKRYDAVCSPVWENGTRARVVDFTHPLVYETIRTWKLATNQLTTHDLNQPSTKIATLDGDMGQVIARQDFPQAKEITLPQSASFSEALTLVTTKKADIVFSETYVATQFNQNNTIKLEPVQDSALRIFPITNIVAKGDIKLKTMLDSVIRSSIQNGIVEKVLAKNNIPEGVLVLPRF